MFYANVVPPSCYRLTTHTHRERDDNRCLCGREWSCNDIDLYSTNLCHSLQITQLDLVATVALYTSIYIYSISLLQNIDFLSSTYHLVSFNFTLFSGFSLTKGRESVTITPNFLFLVFPGKIRFEDLGVGF